MNRKQKVEIVLPYVKKQIDAGIYPSYKDLERKFKVSEHKINLLEIYSKLGVSILRLKCKRPNGTLKYIRKELIEYLKQEVENGHYPTRRFIQNKFNFQFHKSWSIKKLYSDAGIEYSQTNSQDIKNRKAKLLQEIALSVLPKLGLFTVKSRGTHERGVDILCKNSSGELVGVEIKAHHKFEPIKKRNIKQLERFLRNENLTHLVLITTSSKIHADIPKKVSIIEFNALKTFCNSSQKKVLNFIRNETFTRKVMKKK